MHKKSRVVVVLILFYMICHSSVCQAGEQSSEGGAMGSFFDWAMERLFSMTHSWLDQEDIDSKEYLTELSRRVCTAIQENNVSQLRDFFSSRSLSCIIDFEEMVLTSSAYVEGKIISIQPLSPFVRSQNDYGKCKKTVQWHAEVITEQQAYYLFAELFEQNYETENNGIWCFYLISKNDPECPDHPAKYSGDGVFSAGIHTGLSYSSYQVVNELTTSICEFLAQKDDSIWDLFSIQAREKMGQNDISDHSLFLGMSDGYDITDLFISWGLSEHDGAIGYRARVWYADIISTRKKFRMYFYEVLRNDLSPESVGLWKICVVDLSVHPNVSYEKTSNAWILYLDGKRISGQELQSGFDMFMLPGIVVY